MVLYLLVIRFSLCCCTMPCQFFSVYSLSLCSLTHSKCLGHEDDEEELELVMKRGTRGRKLAKLLRPSNFSVGAAHRASSAIHEEGIRWCQKREEIYGKRAICTFAEIIRSRIALSSYFLLRKRLIIATQRVFYLIF